MKICLDFDGVLHDHLHPKPGGKMGPPLAGARDACWQLTRQGHAVYIHTSRVRYREQAQHVYDWLRYFDFPPLLVIVEKPVADVYVDDRGLRHEHWEDTLLALRALNQPWRRGLPER